MAKYDPLKTYLKRQRAQEVRLTFVEMERLIGYMLPKSASRPQWWLSDIQVNASVQARAWTEAGYDAVLIAAEDRVVFHRTAPASPGGLQPQAAPHRPLVRA